MKFIGVAKDKPAHKNKNDSWNMKNYGQHDTLLYIIHNNYNLFDIINLHNVLEVSFQQR